MFSSLHRLADTLVNFYSPNWSQIDLSALAIGFISSLCVAVWIRDSQTQRGYASLIRVLLYFAALNAIGTVGMSLAHRYTSPWVSVFFILYRLITYVADGVVLALLVTSLISLRWSLPGGDTLRGALLNSRTISSARMAVGGLFFAAGMQKLLVKETISFFHASGYSDSFFMLIAIWELVWGVALFWKPTSMLAVLLLGVDMFGAIYTHYHNYFVRGFAGPFGNSVDALRMLILMTYIFFALRQQKTKARTKELAA